ncbi:hypothetical protein BD779DRAFT_472511 [Infundibulicybe gibba]|nr:hypothetical protein BD779DRAFT_472511 [Infundibulicybe gibba]
MPAFMNFTLLGRTFKLWMPHYFQTRWKSPDHSAWITQTLGLAETDITDHLGYAHRNRTSQWGCYSPYGEELLQNRERPGAGRRASICGSKKIYVANVPLNSVSAPAKIEYPSSARPPMEFWRIRGYCLLACEIAFNMACHSTPVVATDSQ